MTDVEMERLSAICAVANVNDIEDLSDGFHTFNDLYEQRMYLFAALVNAYKDKAWKSLKHEDGEPCFGGDWFVVGIDTPEGSYTYHYSIKYWDVFDCEVLPKAKRWDGHTDKDVTRLLSLTSAQPDRWIPCSERLPKENDDYWVTADPRYIPPNYKSTDIVSWYEGKWLMADYFVLDGEKRKMPTYKVMEVNIPIIAWMPLPEPYGGESE